MYFPGQYPQLVAIFSGQSESSVFAEIPYLFLGFTTALVIIASEAITMAFRPFSVQRVLSGRSGRSIANPIPFTNLNVIFAFSIVAIIAILLVLEVAFPTFQKRPFLLGIQMNVFLSCLLITNPEAIDRLQRRMKNWMAEIQLPTVEVPACMRVRGGNCVGPSTTTPTIIITNVDQKRYFSTTTKDIFTTSKEKFTPALPTTSLLHPYYYYCIN